MRFVYNNVAVLFVAAAVSLMGWIFGGTRADSVQAVVPWLVFFALEVLFFFPQKEAGESTYDARERIWERVRRDPLVWTAFGLLLLLAVPFMNNGLCVGCDRVLIAQGLKPEPPVPFLPFCVNRLQHLNVFLWFAGAFAVLIVARHALTSYGKRLAACLIVWNGFALAVLGFIEIATEASGPLWQEMTNVKDAGTFFSTFGYPNMAGDYFTTLFALSLAVWRDQMAEIAAEVRLNPEKANDIHGGVFWRKHVYLIPAVLFYLSAINTLSRAAILLATSLAAIAFVHTFVSAAKRMKRAECLRKGTLCLAITGVSVFVAINTLPNDIQREVDTLDADAVLQRVTGKGQYHVRVATEIWKDHLLFGCGGWGYKHFCIPKMTPAEIKNIQTVGGINVHNDYLQLLAEHGLVGFGALAAIVVMLLMPIVTVWYRLVQTAKFVKTNERPARPLHIFALPAPTFLILMGTLATLIHSFGDCPLRSAAVSMLFFVSLALAAGYLPEQGADAL